jgi:hypothetical protein
MVDLGVWRRRGIGSRTEKAARCFLLATPKTDDVQAVRGNSDFHTESSLASHGSFFEGRVGARGRGVVRAG